MESAFRRDLFVGFVWFVFYFIDIEDVIMGAAWRKTVGKRRANVKGVQNQAWMGG